MKTNATTRYIGRTMVLLGILIPLQTPWWESILLGILIFGGLDLATSETTR